MKTCVFLIILSIIQLGFCCQYDFNLTHDLYPSCPVQYFRRKRAYVDYTRWRANQETKKDRPDEFLVKILDEDLPATTNKAIVAVNYLPATEEGNKIIIGGDNIPLPSTLKITNEAAEYTRFVPPTTISAHARDSHIEALLRTIVGAPLIRSLQPQGVYSQRDDSPPAGPQFIARTPVLVPRQYAPVESVAFNLRTSMNPVTPINSPDFDDSTNPSRTSTVNPELEHFQLFDEESKTSRYQVSRTTYNTPLRTTLDIFEFTSRQEDNPEFEATSKNSEGARKVFETISKSPEKDVESSYNMMFYNDEDTNTIKTVESDTDYDKKVMTDLDDSEYHDPKDLEGNANITSNNEIQELSNVNQSNAAIPTFKTKVKTREKRRPPCNLIKLRNLNFNSPRTLPEIVNQLRIWAENSPVAKWVDITRGNYTIMENPIYMMTVDDPSSGQIVSAKQTVMIVAGIQGRDHHAVAAAMYVLYQLIERNEAHADLLTKYRFWIIPVFNPDGYDYSMTFPPRREWAKNLNQQWDECKGHPSCKSCETHGLRCTIQPCYGVNLDRNFEYQWIPTDELRTEHSCGPLYAGERQLSEAETRALTLFLHEQTTPLSTFIAFKEGSVLGIMYPYSHTKKKRAFDHVYRQRATRAASAAYSISNRPYVAGQTSEFLPLYAGGIEDWVDGHLGIDNTYTVMMFRPTDSYKTKLITERVVHETYAAMDTLLLQSLEPLSPAPTVVLTKVGNSSNRFLPEQIFCLFTVYFILLLNG